MAERTFDSHGRERRYSNQKRWLSEAQERLDNHVHRCIMCLRFEAGRGQEMCSDGLNIKMQMGRIQKGLALTKDPTPMTKPTPEPPKMQFASKPKVVGRILETKNGVQRIMCSCGNQWNRPSRPGRVPSKCTKCSTK